MTTVSVADAQARLPALLDRVAAGHEVVITRDNTTVARLTPIHADKPQPQFGSCKGMLTIARDDGEHLQHFQESMP